MIRAENICLTFGEQAVFNNVSFTFQNNQRVGLVGRNGSGKTTLLKILFDGSSLESGVITTSKNQTIAYMPQHVVLQSDKTVFQEALSTFDHIFALAKRYTELEQALEQNSTDEKIIEEFALISAEIQQNDIHQARLKTEKILKGLGFNELQLSSKVDTLSVGWKMRIVLAKLLLQEADFYLFDEPTNHLDIFAKDWFLSFLKEAPFGFLLVCHERYFLDALCSQIFELELGNGTLYQGNYSSYEEQKKQNRAALQAAYEQQQRELAHKEAIIDKFRAKATKARMAKSMEKQLSKVERIAPPQDNSKSINFNLVPRQKSGRIVLSIDKVSHAFSTKEIFKDASFIVERGQKVAVVAPNGVGKTTLFNIIAGLYSLQKGSIEFGHNVEHALFAQDQDAVLNQHATILEEVSDGAPHKTTQEIRTFLGCFLFGKDAIEKKIKVLSGGEKNRVSMVKILLKDANLLLLDEPTNHLDIQSKEVLLKALQEYQGTIVFVSHDHDFINQLATHIIELTSYGTKQYLGNYKDYCAQKNTTPTTSTQPLAPQPIPLQENKAALSTKERHLLEKECKRLEQKITKLEETIAKQQEKFAILTYGSVEYQKEFTKLRELEEAYTNTMSEWEKIQEKIE